MQLENKKENLTGFTCKLSVLNMQDLLTNCDDVRGLLSNTWIIRGLGSSWIKVLPLTYVETSEFTPRYRVRLDKWELRLSPIKLCPAEKGLNSGLNSCRMFITFSLSPLRVFVFRFIFYIESVMLTHRQNRLSTITGLTAIQILQPYMRGRGSFTF